MIEAPNNAIFDVMFILVCLSIMSQSPFPHMLRFKAYIIYNIRNCQTDSRLYYLVSSNILPSVDNVTTLHGIISLLLSMAVLSRINNTATARYLHAYNC